MRVFIPLGPKESLDLQRLAEREQRTPQQQAAYFVAQGLRRRETQPRRESPRAQQAKHPTAVPA